MNLFSVMSLYFVILTVATLQGNQAIVAKITSIKAYIAKLCNAKTV